jgi:acetyl esterase/lipase
MKLRESVLAFALRIVLRGGLKPALSPRWPISWQRGWLEMMSRIARMPRGIAHRPMVVGGVVADAWQDSNTDSPRAGTILYLHGGGYCAGSPSTHRALTAWLARESGMRVVVPDYRLAPDHPFPAALYDAMAVYDALCEGGKVLIAGDSAGGGLALSLAVALRDSGRPVPARLALLSPWVDLRPSHQPAPVAGEAMLSAEWMQACAAHYAEGRNSDKHVSPILADLHGLPPVLIQCGSDEMLCSQSRALNHALLDAGVDSVLEVEPNRWHVFQVHAGQLPSSTAAVSRIARHLVEHAVDRGAGHDRSRED